ncbi:hypothetical protein LPJ73_001476 [Coemansia sp. RSA 2703]|nr:hypothetical protein LPJ73_001476 [Coemansia sp. RSA 2703]
MPDEQSDLSIGISTDSQDLQERVDDSDNDADLIQNSFSGLVQTGNETEQATQPDQNNEVNDDESPVSEIEQSLVTSDSNNDGDISEGTSEGTTAVASSDSSSDSRTVYVSDSERSEHSIPSEDEMFYRPEPNRETEMPANIQPALPTMSAESTSPIISISTHCEPMEFESDDQQETNSEQYDSSDLASDMDESSGDTYMSSDDTDLSSDSIDEVMAEQIDVDSETDSEIDSEQDTQNV